MIALDAGVLARALNRYAPDHRRAAAVVEGLANGDAPWALPWPAVHAFVRRVTHPHAVARPLGASDAWGFARLLLESPVVRAIGPGPRHAVVVAELLEHVPPGPEGLARLELAAVLREQGVGELWSTDRGMRAFTFLRVRDPLREAAEPVSGPRRYRRLSPRGSGKP